MNPEIKAYVSPDDEAPQEDIAVNGREAMLANAKRLENSVIKLELQIIRTERRRKAVFLLLEENPTQEVFYYSEIDKVYKQLTEEGDLGAV
jgi:hypothetical protein